MRAVKFLVVVAALLLAGCAAGRRVQDLETRVGILDSRVASVEQRQGIAESQTGESRESVGYLKGKVESFPVSPTTIVVGAKGSEGSPFNVPAGKMSKKDIQAALKNANFYNGPVDGVIGKRTKRAIREFQSSVGLKADGIAGKETLEKLAVYFK